MPIPVRDGNNALVNIETPNANGRASAANSRPVALSNEDLAAIQLLATAAAQATGNTALANILTALGSQATAANQAAIISTLAQILLGVTDGPQLTQLEGIAATLLAGLQVRFDGAQPITGTIDVVDGSPRITRVARHVTSTGSVVQAAAANPDRTFLHLVNSSDTDIWYRYDGTASINGLGSIPLRPGDEVQWDSIRTVPTGAISTICGVPGKNLSVWEG